MGTERGGLQDDGEHGDPHRAADLLGDTGADTGVGDLRVAQPFDLLRREILATLAPVPDDVVEEIVDTIFPPPGALTAEGKGAGLSCPGRGSG